MPLAQLTPTQRHKNQLIVFPASSFLYSLSTCLSLDNTYRQTHAHTRQAAPVLSLSAVQQKNKRLHQLNLSCTILRDNIVEMSQSHFNDAPADKRKAAESFFSTVLSLKAALRQNCVKTSPNVGLMFSDSRADPLYCIYKSGLTHL